jgi:hypothetical protein
MKTSSQSPRRKVTISGTPPIEFRVRFNTLPLPVSQMCYTAAVLSYDNLRSFADLEFSLDFPTERQPDSWRGPLKSPNASAFPTLLSVRSLPSSLRLRLCRTPDQIGNGWRAANAAHSSRLAKVLWWNSRNRLPRTARRRRTWKGTARASLE